MSNAWCDVINLMEQQFAHFLFEISHNEKNEHLDHVVKFNFSSTIRRLNRAFLLTFVVGVGVGVRPLLKFCVRTLFSFYICHRYMYVMAH